MLVCIEMFIAAMAHSWCFTYKAHRPEGHRDDEKGPVKTSAGAALRAEPQTVVVDGGESRH